MLYAKENIFAGDVEEIEPDYYIAESQEGEYTKCILEPEGGTITVATIGNVNYASLQDAINASTEEGVITLLLNIPLEESSIEIASDKTVIINLNGRTISSTSSEGAIINSGNLTIRDESLGNSGKIENTVGKAIISSGTLTLGDDSNAVNIDTPSLIGGIVSTGELYFYDGKITGGLEGTVTNKPLTYNVVTNGDITTLEAI